MDALKEFAENVRHYRKKAGLTQVQLAAKMGYDQSSIAKIEAGQVDMPQSKVTQLASILDCSPWDLVPQQDKRLLHIAISAVRLERIQPFIKELNDTDFEKLMERAEELLVLSQMREKKNKENADSA